MSKYSTALVIFMIAFAHLHCLAQKVTTSKDVYETNEPIIVNYSGLPGNKGDWITVVSEGTAAEEYGQYFWTDSRRAGSMDFSGLPAGKYEVRVYYNWPDAGYKISLSHGFEVKAEIRENLSEAIQPPEYWDGWDTLKASDEIMEEVTQDKPAEALLMLTMDRIIEQMTRERNAMKLARLEAAYKRKLLRFLQNSLGLFKNKSFPKITKKELELIAEAYKYSPTIAQRVSYLAETYAGLKRIFGKGGVPLYIRKRIGRAITAKAFSRVFGPLSTLHDLYTIYEFVKETEEVKNAWRGALKSMELMNCADYELRVFRDGLSPSEIKKIEALRMKEAAYFKSQGVSPPIYPPWKHEVDAACKKKPSISFGQLRMKAFDKNGGEISYFVGIYQENHYINNTNGKGLTIDLPPATYELRFYVEGKDVVKKDIVVTAEKLTSVEVRLEEKKKPKPSILVETTKSVYSIDEEVMVNYAVKLKGGLSDRQWAIVWAKAGAGFQDWLQFYPGDNQPSATNLSFGKGNPGKYEMRILLLVPPSRADGLVFETLLAKTNFEIKGEEPPPVETIQVENKDWVGKWHSKRGDMEIWIEDGKIKGRSSALQGYDFEADFISNNKIRGTYKMTYYGNEGEFEWELYQEGGQTKFKGLFSNNKGEELRRSWRGQKFQ